MRLGNDGGQGDVSYGLILDVESGSVGAAITVTGGKARGENVIWSIRHELPLREKIDFNGVANDLTHAIKEVLRISSTDGIRALTSNDASARVAHVLVRIAAPWSFTITKTVHTRHEKPFTVTPAILHELERQAVKAAQVLCEESQRTPLRNLTLIANETVGILINGYPIRGTAYNTASTVSLTEVIEFAFNNVVAAIEESLERTFPAATTSLHTAMETYYTALSTLHLHIDEASLVVVGGEATELGIVRNGILEHATYTPYGLRTIARQFRDNCAMPLPEAHAYIHSANDLNYDANTVAIEEVIELFETNLTELFERTDDSLLLPKSFFVYTEPSAIPFICERITRAAKRIMKSEPMLHLVTPEHFKSEKTDMSLLVGNCALQKKLDLGSRTFFTFEDLRDIV